MSETEFLDFTPESSLVHSVAHQSLKWKDALGEWIDNALGAHATTINIAFSGKSVVVRDNGSGCATPMAIARLGSRAEHGGIGRFGIGAKDAALWVGGIKSTFTIESIHGGTRRKLIVPWERLEAVGWRGLERSRYYSEAIAAVGERGTTIAVEPSAHATPSGVAWAKLLEDIGYFWSPALKNGAQITLTRGKGAKPQIVKRWELPPFEPVHIDERISVNGRAARVFCGLVKEGHPNPKDGLSYLYKFRVILAASQRGCGARNTTRVCGFVELDSAWQLSKNKNAIVAGEEALFAEVERVCRPILERAEAAGVQLESEAFADAMSERLNALIAAARPDRKAKRGSKREETGAIEPKGSERKHRRADREQPGETFGGRGRNTLRFAFKSFGDARIGEVKPPVIYLNTDNAFVRHAQSRNDLPLGLSLAAALLAAADSLQTPTGQRLLRIEGDEFPEKMGVLLGSLRVDGAPALEVVRSA